MSITFNIAKQAHKLHLELQPIVKIAVYDVSEFWATSSSKSPLHKRL